MYACSVKMAREIYVYGFAGDAVCLFHGKDTLLTAMALNLFVSYWLR